MKKRIALALLVFLPVFGNIHAQESTGVAGGSTVVTDVPVEPPTPALPPLTQTPEEILGIILAALFGGAATIAGSVIVPPIVGILKYIIPASVASGDTLKNVVSVVLWVAYSLAIRFGVGTEFNGVATALAPILTALLPLLGTLIGASKVYLAAKNAKVPIVGYQRS